jgi:hypothetical protein
MVEMDEGPANSLARAGVTSCTHFEFEILKLARAQLDVGHHGGTFAPGYVRKETGKGYNAINATLASLTMSGLLERGSHTSQKDGRPVEISLYKITDAGVGVLDMVAAGEMRLEDRPTPQTAKKVERPREPAGQDISANIKRLENDVSAILRALDAIHLKIDVFQTDTRRQKVPPKRARKGDADLHEKIVLETLNGLAGSSRHALSQDVERAYGKSAEEDGLKAGSGVYFKKVVASLEKQSLVKRKYVGCRSLGIRGHGSRLVLEITPEGQERLAQQ